MNVDQAHRAGSLKQTNKAHKTGRHRSKGTIDNDLKGKVSVKAITRKLKNAMRKDQRRNQANQIRHNKRDEIMYQKRLLGSDASSSAPFLACILPLHSDIDPESALAILKGCDPEANVEIQQSHSTHIKIPRFKQRFSFITPPKGGHYDLNALDYLKVCDTTLLLISAQMEEDEFIDIRGKRLLNMAIAQGIPTPIVIIMDLESIAPNRRIKVKVNLQKSIQKLFPDHKPSTLDTETDAFNLFRRIGGQKQKSIWNKDNRPHMYPEGIAFEEDAGQQTGTLKLSGYVRGTTLDVNRLVHIPGFGDFQMSKIVKIDNKLQQHADEDAVFPSQSLQTSLQRENIPDEMDAEQTWPTEEEIAHARAETKKAKLIKRIPKGMSEYQACWIPDVEEKEDVESANDDSDDDDDDDDEDDDEFMSCESEKDSADEFEREEDEEECDTVTVSEAPVNDEKYDLDMDLQEERETWEKIKVARTDQQWPDEIDTPLNVEARNRFYKYRGLESFRASPWDPKENLPADYARIYQFKNFDRTKRRVLKENDESKAIYQFKKMDRVERRALKENEKTKGIIEELDENEKPKGIKIGSLVTVHIPNVGVNRWRYFVDNFPLTSIMYGLLPYEHQMSVVNVVLRRTPDSTIPIKSKERLVIQCGFRRFIVNPIFSQHTNSDRHKYERYFRPADTVVATFYAPIQFPPAPILCFKENLDGSLKLVANGSLLSCNPDRIVLKRIVLSGHPYKINRRTATIRYMFHNKEDVDFFKPVKLRTRCGRVGHIKESLGTHGHMKCVFDGQLKSFDTVFMYLYKRVFPKWTYEDRLIPIQADLQTNVRENKGNLDYEMIDG